MEDSSSTSPLTNQEEGAGFTLALLELSERLHRASSPGEVLDVALSAIQRTIDFDLVQVGAHGPVTIPETIVGRTLEGDAIRPLPVPGDGAFWSRVPDRVVALVHGGPEDAGDDEPGVVVVKLAPPSPSGSPIRHCVILPLGTSLHSTVPIPARILADGPKAPNAPVPPKTTRMPSGFLVVHREEYPLNAGERRFLRLVAGIVALGLARVWDQLAMMEARRLRAELVETVPVPLFVARSTGFLIDVNPAFRDLFGIPADTPIETVRLTDFHDDEAENGNWFMDVAVGNSIRGVEVGFVSRQDEPLVGKVWATVRPDPTGGPPFVEGAIRNVTGRARAEREARILTSAIIQSDAAICIADRTGRVLFVNPSYEGMTGFEASELKGRFFDRAEHPEGDLSPSSRVLMDRLLAGEVVREERVACRADGVGYTEARTITPVRDTGNQITHIISVSRDITSIQRLERQVQQAQKLEAVGRLAGGVAHDFNNLLTVISGHVQLILAQLDPESSIRGDLEGMVQAGNRASALVRRLLAFARREEAAATSGPVDPGSVLGAMETLLPHLIGEDVELVFDVAPGLPAVPLDRSRIEQIFANLVVNARDAMPEGGRILVRAWPEDVEAPGRDRDVLFSVRDTGIGIPRHVQERIFEPFFTTKGEGEGSGLGLATVYGIVTQAGGTIQVASTPGEGATFTIRIPAAAGDGFPALEETRSDPSSDAMPHPAPMRNIDEETRRTGRILVVEDHDLVRAITCTILRDHGYVVDEATSAEDALRIITSASTLGYDLVISDLLMKGMGGERLAAALRELDERFPMLFMSGYRGRHGGEQVEIRGAPIRMVSKPFTVRTLTSAVREAIASSETPSSEAAPPTGPSPETPRPTLGD